MTKPELAAALASYLKNGGRLDKVTAACGVTESTVRRWAKGEHLPDNRIVRQALEKFLAKGASA
jgi:predicted transcriptional regulator